MDPWKAVRGDSGKALVRQFALLSLLVIGAVSLLLSLAMAVTLRRDLLEREWGTTADYLRTGILFHLRPADFAAPGSPGARRHFEALRQQALMLPEIVRVTIYDDRRAVLSSGDAPPAGRRLPDDPHLTQALAGQTVVNLAGGGLSGPNEFAQLVEVYVPIVFPETSRVLGVVEAVKMPRQVAASIRRGRWVVAGVGAAGGLLLYLSLFWIVRRAGRRIEEQHATLARRGQELSTANRDLQAIQAQLVAGERLAAIGEVVTAVAHGIRNPLANIRAAAQVALLECGDGTPAGRVPRTLGSIMAEVDRLEGRLRELLQFVRPAEPQTGPVDLNAVLLRSLELVADRFGKTHATLEQALAPHLPKIRGSAVLLEQVFVSLLGNALEALPETGGLVRLRTGCEGDPAGAVRVFAEVRDSGPGIPAEHLTRIFEPFFTTKAQGTGLGLAIAKKFTEAQEGALSVRSRPGEGSVFRVSFPALQES